jgi:hypothetical protein
MMVGSWKDTTISKLTTTAARWDTDFRALGPFIIGELVSFERYSSLFIARARVRKLGNSRQRTISSFKRSNPGGSIDPARGVTLTHMHTTRMPRSNCQKSFRFISGWIVLDRPPLSEQQQQQRPRNSTWSGKKRQSSNANPAASDRPYHVTG